MNEPRITAHQAYNFRALRETWFNMKLRLKRPEREWETKEEERERELRNYEIKRMYDEDTESLLRGENRAVSPYCYNDIINGRKA